MNKLLFTIAVALVLIGCTSKDALPGKVVQVTFDYTLSQSGSMTRTGEVYDTFYDLFIKTGQLLPKPYSLTISTLEGRQVESVSGEWNISQPVTLATGKYHVVGTSNGGVTYNDYYNKAVLVFDEEIEITESTTSITLHADYDCFLLLFDAAGKTYFRWSADGSSTSGKSGDVSKVSDYYYIFVRELSENNYVQWNYGSKQNTIQLAVLNFQKGYYYYFNDLSGAFEIPKMQPGNL